MADETNSTQTEATTTDTFVVPTPDPGEEIRVLLDAEYMPQITFDPGTESTQEFVGNDLVFTLEGGAVLTFEDFAADVNNGEVSAIMLADGAVIPIEALMAAWNLEVPETAAGPAEASGGSSEYGDDMGDALAGINKLGVQDPDPFGAATPVVQEDEQIPVVPEGENIEPNIKGTGGTVYESGLEDGTGNEPNDIVTEGTITIGDPNALDDIVSLTIDGNVMNIGPGEFISLADMVGESFTLDNGTLVLTGYDGNGTFTYEYTLTSPAFDVDGVVETDSFEVIASDGELAASTVIDIVIEDDEPTVDVERAMEEGEQGPVPTPIPTLTTQDADTIGSDNPDTEDVVEGQDSATESFSSLFNLSYDMGADVGGTAPSLSYSLSIGEGKASTGLTSDGNPITLVMDDGDIVGQTGTGDDAVLIFRISVDGSNGEVTLTQYEELDHLPEDVDGVNDTSNIGLAAGSVNLTASATIEDFDNDTDTDAEVVDISGALSFDDDVPTLDVGRAVTDGEEPVPTAIPSLTTQDEDTIGNDTDSASGDFSGLYTLTSDMGADDGGSAPSLSYSLAIGAGKSASGLSSDGNAITLEMDDGDIVGTTTGGAYTIFRISVDSDGEVTLTQYEKVDHLPEDVDGVNDNTNIGLAAGSIELTASATIVDGDNDSASDSETVDISGAFGFDDDTPTLDVGLAEEPEVPTLTTQDADTIGAATDTDSGSFSSLFTLSSNMGADDDGTAAALGYSLSVTTAATGLTSGGDAITVALVGDDIVGTTNGGTVDIFKVSVDADGNVTLTQYAEIDHLPEDVDGVNDNANIGLAAGNVVLTASATIVDGDNDDISDSQAVDISSYLSFDDDVPAAANDYDSLVVDGEGEGSTDGNVLINDSMGADGPVPGVVSTVTYGDVTYDVEDGGTEVQGAYGLLTIYANGDYTYDYNAEPGEVPVSISAGNLSGATLSGFDLVDPFDGVNLDITATDPDANWLETSGSKAGFGVKGAGRSNLIDEGEQLVVELAEPILGEFTFQIGHYNAQQSDLGAMTWGVFGEDGTLVDSGTFADLGGVANNNGTYTGAPITFDDPVAYIVFGYTDTTGSGYSVSEISYTDLSYPTGLEDFTYTVVDGDNDTSSAHLYITSDSHLAGDSAGNVLTGDSGDNILQGFEGADTLIGGGGLDILVGGDDADNFVFSANGNEGSDVITDFDPSADTLSFADLLDEGAVGLDDDLAAYAGTIDVTVDGDDLVLTVPDQGGANDSTTVTLAGLGTEYAAFDGGTLSDIINSVDPTVNVDTYSS